MTDPPHPQQLPADQFKTKNDLAVAANLALTATLTLTSDHRIHLGEAEYLAAQEWQQLQPPPAA
jgi:hypothetical protein